MKNRRTIIISSIVISILVLGLVIFSYAYWHLAPQVENNVNVNIVIEQGNGYEFVVNGVVNASLNIDGYDMLYNDSLEDSPIIFTSNNASFNVSLKSSADMTCDYDLYWIWDDEETSDNYQLSEGATRELTYTLTSSVGNYNDQIGNSYDDFYIDTLSIRSANGQTTVVPWTANLNFYNVNVVQDYHANKYYSGYFTVKNVSCDVTGTPTVAFVDYLIDNVAIKYTEEQKVALEPTIREMLGLDDSDEIPWKTIMYYPASMGGLVESGYNFLIDFSDVNGDQSVDAGYRYAGPNPNNYIMFNDEKWRIIGVMSDISHGITGEYLIKIIRTTSEYQNVEYGPYQSFASNPLSTNLRNTPYYNNVLVETNVTQNIRRASYFNDAGAMDFYFDENINGELPSDGSLDSIVSGVFIPQLSDYTLSTTGVSGEDYLSCIGTLKDENGSFVPCSNGSWLKANIGHTYWTSTSYSSNKILVVTDSSIIQSELNDTRDVYPVVYLKSNVKYKSGTGTFDDPYIIKK